MKINDEPIDWDKWTQYPQAFFDQKAWEIEYAPDSEVRST